MALIGLGSVHHKILQGLHAVVVRPAAALRRNPGDDLVRVGDVAGLAVHAVRRIQADALAVGLAASSTIS